MKLHRPKGKHHRFCMQEYHDHKVYGKISWTCCCDVLDKAFKFYGIKAERMESCDGKGEL